MKHLNYLFIVLLLAFWGTKVQASVINETDHFYCGFDSEEEFNVWKKVDINGLAGNGNSDWWWDDRGGAFISVGPDVGIDDWLISPEITLTGGKKYVIKTKFYRSEAAGTIRFTMGSTAEPGGQTTIIKELENYSGESYLKFSLPENIENGKYFFGLYVSTEAWTGNVLMKSFEVVEDKDGQLEIAVVNKDDQKAMEGVEVSLSGSSYESQDFTTNAEGKCNYENLTPGTYYLNASLDGYISIEKKEINIGEKETVSFTVEMSPIPVSTVSGTVLDEDNNPIADAQVTLAGEKAYETTTDKDGAFTFNEVRRPNEHNTYKLSISKDFKAPHYADIDVTDATMTLNSIILKDLINAPANICTDLTEKGMFVSWMMPVGEKVFAHDNGKYEGMKQVYAPYVFMGVSFAEPMILTNMTWVSTEVEDELIDIYVFPLNKDGSLSMTPLYEAKKVPVINYNYEDIIQWNEYNFPEPIVAPNGCICAIGHENTLSVPLDYENNTQHSLTVTNYDGGWEVSDISNFLIRAKGLALSTDLSPENQAKLIRSMSTPVIKKVPAKQIENQRFSYNIWRLDSSNKENQEAWTEIAKDVKELYYIDKGFASLDQGTYQYAVQTVYKGDKASEICYSAEIEHKMHTKLTVALFPNTAIDFSKGATIKLTNNDNEELVYTATAQSSIVVFDQVRKGSYTLSVTKEGFQTANSELVIDSQNSYEAYIDLQLAPVAPFNLKAEQTEGTNDVQLKWNEEFGIFEDFEGMEDFALNPTGEIGWTYVDKDGGATYGVAQCEQSPYENMYSPMAYMAFNPTATTPNLLEYVQPYSGNKVLIDVSLENGGVNDDYIFSPELSFESDFTLRFYAASGFYAAMGDEEFMVGYTTDEAQPENVIWLTEKPQTVGGIWTEFVYNMPKEARHTVIRCVSNQHMFFMLDDIFIGQREPEVFAMTTFNVYMDEELVETTTQRSVTFNNLSEGKHIAKVQAVYPMRDDSKQYSEFTELLFTVEAGGGTGINTNNAEVLYTYNTETGIITPGNNTRMIEMIDTQGRCCASCQSNETINTNGFTEGIYILKITTESQVSFSKILVK